MKQFLNVLKFELGNYFKSRSFMVTRKAAKRQQKAVPERMTTIRMRVFWGLLIRKVS